MIISNITSYSELTLQLISLVRTLNNPCSCDHQQHKVLQRTHLAVNQFSKNTEAFPVLVIISNITSYSELTLQLISLVRTLNNPCSCDHQQHKVLQRTHLAVNQFSKDTEALPVLVLISCPSPCIRVPQQK